jgi:hypothetical protein
VTGSQYAKAAGHFSDGTNGGFAPRYYNATHIWASTITAGTLLPKRYVYPPRSSPAINPGGLLVGAVNHSSFTKNIARQHNSHMRKAQQNRVGGAGMNTQTPRSPEMD